MPAPRAVRPPRRPVGDLDRVRASECGRYVSGFHDLSKGADRLPRATGKLLLFAQHMTAMPALALRALAVLMAGAVVAAISDAPPRLVASHAQVAAPAPQEAGAVEPQAVIEQSCVTCHNDRAKAGGLSR